MGGDAGFRQASHPPVAVCMTRTAERFEIGQRELVAAIRKCYAMVNLEALGPATADTAVAVTLSGLGSYLLPRG